MTPDTTRIRTDGGARSMLWLAGAVGAGIGIAAIAYSRKPKSRWERARDRAGEWIDTAKEQAQPWMGVAAGTAAAGSALAVYRRSRKETGWQGASRRAREVAAEAGARARPWANIAVSAAIALASVASSRKARRRTIRGINENTADAINALTDKGQRLVRRVRELSDQTRKVYPSIRRVIA